MEASSNADARSLDPHAFGDPARQGSGVRVASLTANAQTRDVTAL